jgi:hypothetical protein
VKRLASTSEKENKLRNSNKPGNNITVYQESILSLLFAVNANKKKITSNSYCRSSLQSISNPFLILSFFFNFFEFKELGLSSELRVVVKIFSVSFLIPKIRITELNSFLLETEQSII